jgi:hypothetical protein
MGQVDLFRSTACTALLSLLATSGCASWLRGDEAFGSQAGASPYLEAPRPPPAPVEDLRGRVVTLRLPEGCPGPVVVTLACMPTPARAVYRPSPYEDERTAYRPSPYEDEPPVRLPPKPSPYEDAVDVPPSPYGYD